MSVFARARARFAATALFSLALAVSASGGASAQTIAPLGDAFQVNSFTTGNQLRPDVAMTAAGEFVVVWDSDSDQDGEGTGIFGQRFLADGAANGTEFLVNTYTTENQVGANATITADGEFFVVAWERTDTYGSAFRLAQSRPFDATGPIGPESRLADSGNTFETVPAIAILENGASMGSNFTQGGLGAAPPRAWIAAWEAQTGSNGSDVKARGFDPRAGLATGEPGSVPAVRTDEFVVNSFPFGYQGMSDICADANGGFVIVWQSQYIDGDDFGISAQRFDSDGNFLGTEFVVNTYTTSYQVRPDVCCDRDGDFIVAWESGMGQDGDGRGVFGRRYTKTGDPAGGEFLIPQTTMYGQQDPSLACDGAGNFVVAWTDTSPAYDRGRLFGRGFLADATPAGDEFLIADGVGFLLQNTSLAMSNGGRFVATWGADNIDGATEGIGARLYSFDVPTTTTLSTSTTTSTTSTTTSTTSTTTTTMPSGQGCGDPIVDGGGAGFGAGRTVTASDALFVLNAAVAIVSCDLCVCDVDSSGATTATDALATLGNAVGQDITLMCPPCS